MAQHQRRRHGCDRRLFGQQDRYDGVRATPGVEVVKVDRIVLNLATILGRVLGAVRLGLDHEDGMRCQKDHVRAATQTQHRVFEHEPPAACVRQCAECMPEHGDRRAPGP